MNNKFTAAVAVCLAALIWGGDAFATSCAAQDTKNLPSCVDLTVSGSKQEFWATNNCSYLVMMNVTVTDGFGSGRTRLNAGGLTFHMDITSFQSPDTEDTAQLTSFSCCDGVVAGDGEVSSCG